MKKRLFLAAAILAMACGGSTDAANGSGGTAGAGASGAAGAAGTTDGGAGMAGAAGSVGGAAGASGSAGIGGGAAFGGGGTGANAACDAIEEQHAQALQQSKACPLSSSDPTCTQSVDTSVQSCGYWALSDASNVDALSELAKLKKQWKDLGCTSKNVCATGGWGGMPSHCEAGGQSGSTGLCTPN